MKTEILFYDDAYSRSIDATVLEVRGNALILDRTIFYAESGGQPGDRGFFGPHEIVDTQKDKDGEFLHILKNGAEVEVGQRMTLSLDWDHRYKYMVEHSAQHLLSATMFTYKGIGTVAVHQGEEILTIETDAGEIADEDLLLIEDIANGKIRDGLRIYQEEMSHERAESLGMRRSIKVDGDVKVVFIEGLDAVACGGVHVSSTKEIKEVVYRGKEMIRSHVRTIWSCGDASVSYRRENERLLKGCYKLLSADKETILKDVERIIRDNNDLSYEIKRLKKNVAERELEDALRLSSTPSLLAFITESNVEDFQEAVSRSGREVLILEREGKKGFMYFGTKERFLKLKGEISLKGGGKDILFRGAYQGDAEEVLSISMRLLGERGQE